MRFQAIELRRISLPLVSPFRTSFGVEAVRDILLVRVLSDEAEGWGECTAAALPAYSSEYVDGARDVLRRFLAPPVFALSDSRATSVAPALAHIKGHRMAKAALEMAVLDAELRSLNMSLAHYLGGVRDRVECGVSVGIEQSIPTLVDAVGSFLERGYKRIKLKIQPGWDVEPVRAVREKFGDDLLLQVDANCAYSPADVRHLAKLDAFDLLLIEQPLKEDEVLAHAALAKSLKTPICLDESITSSRAAADAIAVGACSIVNIKAGRVGGYLEARRVHDMCRAHGVPVWCGGMLETGLGRAANVALASLENFSLPGDTSSSDRYYRKDITEPFELEDGTLRVPQGPGLGVAPIPDLLEEATTSAETLRPTD